MMLYRLRRLGRAEWLDANASPTDSRAMARVFNTYFEAGIFRRELVDEPSLWSIEPFAVAEALVG